MNEVSAKEALTKDTYRELTYQAAEYYNKKDYKKALGKFLEMGKSNPDNLKVHEMLVYTYLKLGDLKKSEKEFLIYLKLAEEQMESFSSLPTFNELAQRAGKIGQAEENFEKLMTSPKPENIIEDTEIPFKLCILYINQGNYQKAEEVIVRFREAYTAAAI